MRYLIKLSQSVSNSQDSLKSLETILPTNFDLRISKVEKGKDVTKLLTDQRKRAKSYYD